MIYLDSSAAVKLVHAEPETQALRAWLDERADVSWVSSVLIEVESYRALARHAPDAVSRLPAVLDLIDVVELTPQIRSTAYTVRPDSMRSLDAIHLATALQLGDRLTAFVAYDTRLADAARAAGLPVEVPVGTPPVVVAAAALSGLAASEFDPGEHGIVVPRCESEAKLNPAADSPPRSVPPHRGEWPAAQ